MTVNDRKCATFVAATALSLSFFATCASSSHAALRSDRPPVSVLLALHGREGVVRTQSLESTSSFAGHRRRMIATAYAAACDGCGGITKAGVQAGRGIVAVDPRFIPLGTKLYVPGYGRALAADTGGAIQGRRIDLGFDSLREARRFGRREIVVYVLR